MDADDPVDKWFRKNRADDRKVLLSRPYDPDVCVDYSSQRITFGNYFEQEYITSLTMPFIGQSPT